MIQKVITTLNANSSNPISLSECDEYVVLNTEDEVDRLR